MTRRPSILCASLRPTELNFTTATPNSRNFLSPDKRRLVSPVTRITISAWLFYRWSASEEGQKAYAAGGRLPPHPKVEPVEKIRPAKLYPIGTAVIKQWRQYEKAWTEIFRLR